MTSQETGSLTQLTEVCLLPPVAVDGNHFNSINTEGRVMSLVSLTQCSLLVIFN